MSRGPSQLKMSYLASNVDNEQKWLLRWLIACCIIIVVCPLMEMYDGDDFSFVILIGGYLLFPLSFTALFLSLWGAVRTGRLKKTEAWWWLSIPYSVGFPLTFVVLQLEVNFHVVGLFVLVWVLTSISSAVWILVAIGPAGVFPREEFTTTKKKLMIGLASLALVLAIVLLARGY
jgi:hypothetical protein